MASDRIVVLSAVVRGLISSFRFRPPGSDAGGMWQFQRLRSVEIVLTMLLVAGFAGGAITRTV